MTEVRRRIKESQKQEKRGASQLGGRVRPGSGSMIAAKGDVRTSTTAGQSMVASGMLVEYKRTDKKSISVTVMMLEKIRREALLDGRRPRLGIELGGRDWIMVPAEDYLELEERASGEPQ